ncbi:MAG: glycosyltransferase family 2 protein [Flavobacteriales bacterium]|nr:glycosyltransferase family 2 protein [Flavobacteriales bacterium]HRH68051.1 glycosyltransferase family 2 protein [Flavobacteriales bacterium]
MTGISAVIITRNEAHNIGSCLAAVTGVVDEIIVVDAESTDDTRRIAETAGARVIVRKWTDYSDQKNFANAQATGTYILSLDADEVLSPGLTTSIHDELRTGLTGAYKLNRLTNYCGTWVRHGGWYPDAKVRLFPKEGTRWEGEHVHEELRLAPGTIVRALRGDLLHYSYRSVEDHIARLERYSDLHARKMLAAGKHPGALKQLFSPMVKFIQTYVLKLGILDGLAGWRIARYSARGVRLKYAKLSALRNTGGHS